jgi:hypothetical protein
MFQNFIQDVKRSKKTSAAIRQLKKMEQKTDSYEIREVFLLQLLSNRGLCLREKIVA